jgi:hypothetical protein
MNAKPHIARTYRNMTDEQILQFVDDEGAKLTPEALTLLYQEFVRRKLNTEKIAALRSLRTQNYVMEVSQRLSHVPVREFLPELRQELIHVSSVVEV